VSRLVSQAAAAERAADAKPKPTASGDPVVSAKAAILIDDTTGIALYELNARQRCYPASLSKMMTALLCVEKMDLDQTVTVSARAAAVGEATLNLEPGEKIKLRHLLFGLLMNSANDAAVAAAEAVGGDYDAFIEMMNARARELGLNDTHFTNPHGLHNPDHYSTAYDLAHLARTAMAVEEIRKIADTEEAVVPWPSKPWDRKLVNRNQLLAQWPAADGVKTGYTKQAGRCLVASATVDGWRLIGVCLDCKDTFGDGRTLLEWGFENFHLVKVVRKGPVQISCTVNQGRQKSVPVAATQELALPVKRDAKPPKPDIDLPPAEAPIEVGQQLGYLWVAYRGNEYRIPLAATAAVDKNLWAQLVDNCVPAALLLLLLASSVGVLVYGAAAKIAGTRRYRLAQGKREADSRRARLGQRQDSHSAGHQSRPRD